MNKKIITLILSPKVALEQILHLQLLNKKGDDFMGLDMSQMLWAARLIWLGALTLACLVLITLFSLYAFSSEPAEREIFIQRVLYAPDGLSYFNSLTGRLELGTIDLKKFDSAVLDKLAVYSSDRLGAKFSLTDLDNQQNKVIYYNQNYYTAKLEPAMAATSGGPDSLKREFYVLIKDKGNIHRGRLKVEVLMFK